MSPKSKLARPRLIDLFSSLAWLIVKFTYEAVKALPFTKPSKYLSVGVSCLAGGSAKASFLIVGIFSSALW